MSARIEFKPVPVGDLENLAKQSLALQGGTAGGIVDAGKSLVAGVNAVTTAERGPDADLLQKIMSQYAGDPKKLQTAMADGTIASQVGQDEFTKIGGYAAVDGRIDTSIKQNKSIEDLLQEKTKTTTDALVLDEAERKNSFYKTNGPFFANLADAASRNDADMVATLRQQIANSAGQAGLDTSFIKAPYEVSNGAQTAANSFVQSARNAETLLETYQNTEKLNKFGVDTLPKIVDRGNAYAFFESPEYLNANDRLKGGYRAALESRFPGFFQTEEAVQRQLNAPTIGPDGKPMANGAPAPAIGSAGVPLELAAKGYTETSALLPGYVINQNRVVGDLAMLPRPLAEMGMGEVIDWGKKVLIPLSRFPDPNNKSAMQIHRAANQGKYVTDPAKALGSGAVGGFQITPTTRERFAPQVFGENWKFVKASFENDMLLAKAIFDEAAKLKTPINKVWQGLGNAGMTKTADQYRWEDILPTLVETEGTGKKYTPIASKGDDPVNRDLAKKQLEDIKSSLRGTNTFLPVREETSKVKMNNASEAAAYAHAKLGKPGDIAELTGLIAQIDRAFKTKHPKQSVSYNDIAAALLSDTYLGKGAVEGGVPGRTLNGVSDFFTKSSHIAHSFDTDKVLRYLEGMDSPASGAQTVLNTLITTASRHIGKAETDYDSARAEVEKLRLLSEANGNQNPAIKSLLSKAETKAATYGKALDNAYKILDSPELKTARAKYMEDAEKARLADEAKAREAAKNKAGQSPALKDMARSENYDIYTSGFVGQ